MRPDDLSNQVLCQHCREPYHRLGKLQRSDSHHSGHVSRRTGPVYGHHVDSKSSQIIAASTVYDSGRLRGGSRCDLPEPTVDVVYRLGHDHLSARPGADESTIERAVDSRWSTVVVGNSLGLCRGTRRAGRTGLSWVYLVRFPIDAKQVACHPADKSALWCRSQRYPTDVYHLGCRRHLRHHCCPDA